MRDFEISVDSTCDLYDNEIQELDLDVGVLEYTIEDKDDVMVESDNYTCYEEYVKFYERLKAGAIAKTSILSVQTHVELFTALAKRGVKKLLHLTQSYGLSPTLDNANAAISIVKEQFPDIDYVAVECNTTTVGEGMLVRAACKMRDEGKTREEVVEKINELKGHVQHFILANDLKFLARGGRISKASAGIGTMLQVKPIIEFGKDGKLKVVRKEIGLRKALTSIVNEYANYTANKEFPYICIVHTNNETLAKELQAMLKAKYGIEPEIRIMGPIIGAHVGPNSVAYAFISNEERPVD